MRRPKKPPRSSVRPPPPVVFHPDAPSFSPRVLTRGEEWPALLDCTDTPHAAQALTKTTAPDIATPAAAGSSKIDSNHAQPMDGQIAPPSPPANPDSDIMLAASFGGSDGNYDCVKSVKKPPTRPANMPDPKGHISKLEIMHEVSEGDINSIV